MFKKLIAILMAVVFMCGILPGCSWYQLKDEEIEEEEVTVRVGAMSGPTAMGMVKLMKDAQNGETKNTYSFAELSSDASTFVAPLTTGKIDIAAVPSNLAANIYNSTEGGVTAIAVNVLGVLNLVERGETINKLGDLKGKTIYATGQGAVPEYAIRHILSSNGIDPDKDVTIQWCADTTETLSYIRKKDGAIAVLPQPFVTAAAAQLPDLRIVLDLNDAWAELETESSIVTGVIVVRTEFLKKYPMTVERFLKDYADSVSYIQENMDEAAELVVEYGILNSVDTAKKALPKCSIVCSTGYDCKRKLEGFLKAIYNQNSKAIGGKMPGDDFYYGVG